MMYWYMFCEVNVLITEADKIFSVNSDGSFRKRRFIFPDVQ
jgi:hypothetical protein